MSTGFGSQHKVMTAEEIMSLPDDGVERDIIRGELKERSMERRNPFYSDSEMCIGQVLKNWRDQQHKPRGKVVGGEAGFRLKKSPESFVGIDVAYISPEMVASHNPKLKYFDGPPVLAVEILSSSDDPYVVREKVELHQEVGTVVWIVDPYLRTLAVHVPGQPLALYNDRQELSGDPYLPGFRVAVAQLFDSD
jgi:Uma2 family endonuclease